MLRKRILSVGQCAADHWAIGRLVNRHFDAELHAADTIPEALNALRQTRADLVLVNRILDADGSSGLAFIRQLKTDQSLSDIPVMLVSNYDDAQSQAATLGALPGFGKAVLEDPRTLTRLEALIPRRPAP
jgi:CheY-like chemotaxis protein